MKPTNKFTRCSTLMKKLKSVPGSAQVLDRVALFADGTRNTFSRKRLSLILPQSVVPPQILARRSSALETVQLSTAASDDEDDLFEGKLASLKPNETRLKLHSPFN